jgi:hypothetical protein
MLKTLLGLFALIFFYFGTYKLIKDHIKINAFFIPVFINLGIMLLLYVAGLIGVLRPAVWVIGFTGILYFIIYLIKNRNLIHSDVKNAIILGLGTIKAFFNKNSIVQALMLLIVSSSSSFAFMNMTINIWVHGKILIVLLFVFMTCLTFPIIYIHVDQSLELIKKDRLYRNLSIWIFILSIVFFVVLLSGNKILIPRTDSITIRNMGTENANTYQSEIVLIEVKDKSTGTKLKYELTGNWADVSLADNVNGIISTHLGDTLVLNYSDKGPTTYGFLFNETPTSGVVEININRDTYIYDLYNESVNHKIIDLRSRYYQSDILILCANLLFSVISLQIVLKLVYLYKTGQEGPFLSKYNKYFLYLFLIIILFLFTRPMHFWAWDEFSHWGTFIKELSIKDRLPTGTYCTVVPRYIPGIPLFEYFFTTFLGYAEGHAYFAYLFFVVSAIWIVLVDIPPQKILLRLMYLLSIIIALFFLPLYFMSLYVDAALGLLFGVGLIYYYKYRETSFGEVGIFLIFCGLQLMKNWGLVFSVILFGIIFIDKIFFQKQEIYKGKHKPKKQVVFLILCLLGSIILVLVPWQIHLQENGIENSIGDGENLLNSFQNGTEYNVRTIFNNWIEITTKGRQDTYLHGVLSILSLSLILLSVGILISYKDKQIVWFNLFIFLFFIINIFLLFVSYIIYFSVAEGIKFASYERYASEFFLGWFLILIYQMSTCFSLGRCSHKSLKITHMSLIAMIAVGIPVAIKVIQLPPQNYIGRRETLRYILEKYEDTIFDGNDNKIFHIAQNTNGLSHHMLRYELCPNTAQYTAQNEGWSFGDPYPSLESECETTKYNIEELYTIITSDYDYVLITKPDKQLWKYYGDIFQGHKLDGDQLFKVDKEQIIFIE